MSSINRDYTRKPILWLESEFVTAEQSEKWGKIAPAANVLTARYETSAVAVSYLVRNLATGKLETSVPRVNKDLLPTIQQEGREIEVHWFWIDYDMVGHADLDPAWCAEQKAKVEAALGPVVFYSTRHGVRAAKPFSTPLTPEDFERFTRYWIGERRKDPKTGETVTIRRGRLEDFGILADSKCLHWNCLFFLPRCKRDRRTLEPLVLDIPVDLPPMDPEASREHWQGIELHAVPTPAPRRPGSRPPVRVAADEADEACIDMAQRVLVTQVGRMARQKMKGDRNGLLYWCACRVGEVVEWLDHDVAKEALVDAAIAAGLSGGEREARRTVESGINSGLAGARNLRAELAENFQIMAMLTGKGGAR